MGARETVGSGAQFTVQAVNSGINGLSRGHRAFRTVHSLLLLTSLLAKKISGLEPELAKVKPELLCLFLPWCPTLE